MFLEEKQEKDLFQQIEFLVSMKLFASWSFNAVKKLFLVLDTREFKKNMSVYTENDPPNYMYIIKSGEFKVLKALSYFKNPDTLQKKIQSLEHEAGNYALSNLKNPLLLNKTCEVI